MPRFHLAMYYPQSPMVLPDDVGTIMAEIEELNDEMRDSRVWVMAASLAPAPEAHVVTADDGGADTADGPYQSTREHAGCFWIIDSPSKGDALVWAERASRILRVPIEVREVVRHGAVPEVREGFAS